MAVLVGPSAGSFTPAGSTPLPGNVGFGGGTAPVVSGSIFSVAGKILGGGIKLAGGFLGGGIPGAVGAILPKQRSFGGAQGCPPGTVPTVRGGIFGIGGKFTCAPIPGSGSQFPPGGGVVPPFGGSNLPVPVPAPGMPAGGGGACPTSCLSSMEVAVNGPKLTGTRTVRGKIDACGNFIPRRRSIDPSNAKAARRSISRVKSAVRHQNRLVEALLGEAKSITPTKRRRSTKRTC